MRSGAGRTGPSTRSHEDLIDVATNARKRIVAIAVDGLRAVHTHPLPGAPPTNQLFTERWEHRSDAPVRVSSEPDPNLSAP